jgi:hypothetical protein
MLDGIFKLLRLEVVLVVAVFSLLLKAGIWLARTLSNRIPNKSQHPTLPQPPIQASPPPQAQYPTPAPVPPAQPQPPIHVTVNLPPEPVRPPLSQTAAVLDHPDHGIYVTASHDVIFPHSRADELLEMLDKMMFIAAHRNGDPFNIPPAPDTSPLATEPLPEMPLEDGFDLAPLRALPAADDRLWMAKAGEPFTPLPPPEASGLRKASTP